jgi:hypothetical protein
LPIADSISYVPLATCSIDNWKLATGNDFIRISARHQRIDFACASREDVTSEQRSDEQPKPKQSQTKTQVHFFIRI